MQLDLQKLEAVIINILSTHYHINNNNNNNNNNNDDDEDINSSNKLSACNSNTTRYN